MWKHNKRKERENAMSAKKHVKRNKPHLTDFHSHDVIEDCISTLNQCSLNKAEYALLKIQFEQAYIAGQRDGMATARAIFIGRAKK